MLIGLTGGIGSGKTTVSDMFSELGIQIIDADIISRNLTASGGKAIQLIEKNFGTHSIDSNGGMDRKYIRELVFNSPKERKKLESILHPLIREEILEKVRKALGQYSLLSVPLMNKNSVWPTLCDRILLVDCPEEEQIKRVQIRSKLSEAEIKKIISSQSAAIEKLSFADDVIFNFNSLEALQQKVLQLHELYLRLSKTLPK